jgi:hypothetical protein
MLAKIDRPAKEEQMRDLLKKDMVGSWVGLIAAGKNRRLPNHSFLKWVTAR